LFSILNICCGREDVAATPFSSEIQMHTADNALFKYVGRIDFSNPLKPRFWTGGVYIMAQFEGDHCELHLNDEILWGNSHNYVSVSIDNGAPKRIKLANAFNILTFENLGAGEHAIIICKSTESHIGYLEFLGMKCKRLLPVTNMPSRKIEFYGDSITSGMGSDESDVKCDKGVWYDQTNAYLSYGPVTARTLNAQWMLSSVSGIGMIHSCCDMKLTMPDVFASMDLHQNKGTWNFSYSPDVVTICLGQNDGIQDSLTFCSKYVSFVKSLQGKYPKANFICMTSPMADDQLVSVLKRYLTGIVSNLNSDGEEEVYKFYFSKRYTGGCGAHPSVEEHAAMANELAAFIKQKMNW